LRSEVPLAQQPKTPQQSSLDDLLLQLDEPFDAITHRALASTFNVESPAASTAVTSDPELTVAHLAS
jgi:hypothetical protein